MQCILASSIGREWLRTSSEAFLDGPHIFAGREPRPAKGDYRASGLTEEKPLSSTKVTNHLKLPSVIVEGATFDKAVERDKDGVENQDSCKNFEEEDKRHTQEGGVEN